MSKSSSGMIMAAMAMRSPQSCKAIVSRGLTLLPLGDYRVNCVPLRALKSMPQTFDGWGVSHLGNV